LIIHSYACHSLAVTGTHVKDTGSTDPLEHNRNFHRAIYTCSGNQLLADMLDSLWDKTDRYRRILLDIDGGTDPHPTHSVIAEALARRSGSEVRDLIRRHVQAKHDAIMDRLPSYLSSVLPEGGSAAK
jgi:DNA-binding GntR family transcriptional regulator